MSIFYTAMCIDGGQDEAVILKDAEAQADPSPVVAKAKVPKRKREQDAPEDELDAPASADLPKKASKPKSHSAATEATLPTISPQETLPEVEAASSVSAASKKAKKAKLVDQALSDVFSTELLQQKQPRPVSVEPKSDVAAKVKDTPAPAGSVKVSKQKKGQEVTASASAAPVVQQPVKTKKAKTASSAEPLSPAAPVEPVVKPILKVVSPVATSTHPKLGSSPSSILILSLCR